MLFPPPAISYSHPAHHPLVRLPSLSRGCSDSRQFLLKHRTVDPAFSRPLGLSLNLIPLFVRRCYKPLQSMFSSHLSYSGSALTASSAPLPFTRLAVSLGLSLPSPCPPYQNLPVSFYFPVFPPFSLPPPIFSTSLENRRRLSLDSCSRTYTAM